jgi:phage-related tail fiber protein
MADYYTLLTNAGLAHEAACKANGVAIKLSKFSVGDGKGSVYNPDATMTELRREVWRGDINALLQDANNPSWLVAELLLPDNVGGWYIREAGIWTDTGILYAVVKYPESYKPVLATTGAGKEFYIRAIFQTSNAPNVVLAVDESIVKATRAWVVDYVAGELAKLDYKQSVRVATTGNITLSGAQTIDSVPVVAGDRVLVKNQTNAWLNGIYVVANGAWIRAADADASVEVTSELMVAVEEGNANGDSLWHLTTNAPIVVGTTPLAFAQIYTAAQVVTLLAAKAPLDSPALKGKPTTPTPAGGTNDLQISNTAFVMTEIAKAISNLIGGAGPALDQLNELAAALGNDPNFATTIATALGLKAPLASPALSGLPTAPTPAIGNNSNLLATTAFLAGTLQAYGLAGNQAPNFGDTISLDTAATGSLVRCEGMASKAAALSWPSTGVSANTPQAFDVMTMGTAGAAARVVQFATEVFGAGGSSRGRTFIRVKHDSAWYAWRELAFTDAFATVATTGKFSDLLDQTDHVFRGATSGVAWKTVSLLNADPAGHLSLEYRNSNGVTVMSLQGLNDGKGGWRPRFYYTKAGLTNADRRTYWGGVNDDDIVEFAGPMQVRQGGYLLDKTTATLCVKSDASDGTGGLTVSSLAPTLAMVDRSEGARSSRWRTDANGLYLDWDNADNGATWNPPLLTVLPVGEILSKSPNNWRIMSGNYGTFWRNDGASLYLMITASGDPAGPWSPLRPLAIDLASGRMVCSNGLGITTAGRGDNSTNAASTAFVMEAVGNRAGAVDFFARSDAPFGYLKANGAAVSRATYSALFAAIGTLHGAGDGSTTFNLPDMRGEFARGWDDARGVDANRVIGSWQASQNLEHKHTASTASAGSHSHTTSVKGDRANGEGNLVYGDENWYSDNLTLPTTTAGAHTHSVFVDNSGGSESRPRNVALLACIKF